MPLGKPAATFGIEVSAEAKLLLIGGVPFLAGSLN
jgi:hypothetical protein